MYYDKNMKLLKKKYFDLYTKIENRRVSEDYMVLYTEDNLPTLKVKIDTKSILLNSKYDPVGEARLFIQENVEDGIQNYIVFGLGLGYHVQELVRYINRSENNPSIYVVESNMEVFRTAMEEVDLTEIIKHKNITLFLAPTAQELSKVFNHLLNLKNHKFIIHRPSLSIMKKELKEFKGLLEDQTLIENSLKSYSNLMETNFKYNIENFDRNVDELFNRYHNIPAYIVSAGPSLDKNMDKLKTAKNKGIILSVGRAVRSLVHFGIEPDLIIITDPVEYLYDMQLKDIDIKVPIIVLSTCDKNVMKNYNGNKFIALQRGYVLAEKVAEENKNILVNTGGSVATTALDIVIKMGCNPIIFVGQDLAFTDNRTHAKDTYAKELVKNKNLLEIEDIHGNMIYTQKNLHSYLRWMERRISKEKDITFIDATEGGAKIEGTQIVPLEKTINKYSDEYLFDVNQ